MTSRSQPDTSAYLGNDRAGTGLVKVDHRFEQGTRRLARTVASRPGGFVMDLRYAYDPAGNPTRVGDEVTGRAECYAYDGYRRLTDAWTPADGTCATAPGQAVLGGPAGFWNREVYDTVGNRLTQQATRVTGTGTTSTTTTAYTYPDPGDPRPHAPLTVSATRTSSAGTTPTGPTTDTGVFGYDQAGNTTSDPELFGSGRVLTWDAEGRLASVTSPAGTSSFTYTADGDRLVRRDPGATTVYLPGGQELTTTAGGQVRATRYYTAGGTTIAVRTETDTPEAFPFGHVTITVADPHGTGQLGFTTHTGELIRRYTDPYGVPLDQSGAWPTDRGFLNKPVDATGYTHIGARYYNPTHGRFLTVDPIMDLTDPAQWHPYTYANNNPITYTDPTGLAPQYGGWDTQYYKPVVKPKTQYYNPVPPTRTLCRPARPSLTEVRSRYQVTSDPEGTTVWKPSGFKGFVVDVLGANVPQTVVTQGEAKMLDRLGLNGLRAFGFHHQNAFSEADSRYRRSATGDGNNDHNDAFRHAFWSASLAKHFGVGWAQDYTTAHERLPNNEPEREAMDLYNNAVGLRIANDHPGATLTELADLVQSAVDTGQAVVIARGGNLAWSDAVGIDGAGYAPATTLPLPGNGPGLEPIGARS